MRSRLLLTCGSAAVAIGCTLDAPFARTNPYDPEAPFTFNMLGPDSIHALGEPFTFSVVVDPPSSAPLTFITWGAASPVRLLPEPPLPPMVTSGGGGAFVVVYAEATYRPVVISALVDTRPLGRTVIVGQRVASIELSCTPWTQAFTPCDAHPAAFGDTLRIHARLADPRGNPIRGVDVAMTEATITSRNTAVILPVVVPNTAGILRAVATGSGTTWLVMSGGVATDSIRIVVAP